jgi:hypothetical protein
MHDSHRHGRGTGGKKELAGKKELKDCTEKIFLSF